MANPKTGKTHHRSKDEEFSRMMQYGRYNDCVDFAVPTAIVASLNLTNQYVAASKKDSLYVSQHSISLSGDVNITALQSLVLLSFRPYLMKQLQTSSFDIWEYALLGNEAEHHTLW